MEVSSLKVLISASPTYNNYAEVMRNISLFINELVEQGHTHITFVHDGKTLTAKHADEFINKIEVSLRTRGIYIKKIVRPLEIMSDADRMLAFGGNYFVTKALSAGVQVHRVA
jgi:hypothetical protein